MLTERIKELEAAKAKVQDLEQKIRAERPDELASLPGRYGFTSLSEFIKAVKTAVAAGGARKKPGRKPKAQKAVPAKKAKKAKKAGNKSRGRARITDEIRAKVKALVEAGETGSAIAKTLEISAPSVQNIKKDFGLVKPRKAAPAPEAAPAAPEAPAS